MTTAEGGREGGEGGGSWFQEPERSSEREH